MVLIVKSSMIMLVPALDTHLLSQTIPFFLVGGDMSGVRINFLEQEPD
jgi:hypothetical protein